MPERETRIRSLMRSEGLAYMQALNVIRSQDITHERLRRDPRAFDHRFQREC